MARIYEVRDPVHNFILFRDFERDLINSDPVQRLKHIKQLALSYEVYPGATHSRFEHSLGTMELATQAFDAISLRAPAAYIKLGWTDAQRATYRQLLRVGALLHDIGHPPFSNAPEHLLPEGYRWHEDFTEALIRSGYVLPLLDMGVATLNVEQVVAVALGQEKCPQDDPSIQLLQELVAGELGVDRIDYLVRDALHTGASAGLFDYHRLLNTLTVIEHPVTDSPVLAIEEGGLHAAEGLILARYFMFLQVYFHDTRRIYDRHLVDFLSEALPNGRFPADLGGYLGYTDDWVHVAIMMASRSGGRQAELAGRLLGRNHFRMVVEVSGKDKVFFTQLAQHMTDRFGDLIRTDEAEKQAQSIEPERIYVVEDNGNPHDILEVSELILSLKPMWRARIYARADVQDEVQRACEELAPTDSGEAHE